MAPVDSSLGSSVTVGSTAVVRRPESDIILRPPGRSVRIVAGIYHRDAARAGVVALGKCDGTLDTTVSTAVAHATTDHAVDVDVAAARIGILVTSTRVLLPSARFVLTKTDSPTPIRSTARRPLGARLAAQRPFHCGGRFSMNASSPSLRSSLCITSPNPPAESFHFVDSSEAAADARMMRRVARTARGAFASI